MGRLPARRQRHQVINIDPPCSSLDLVERGVSEWTTGGRQSSRKSAQTKIPLLAEALDVRSNSVGGRSALDSGGAPIPDWWRVEEFVGVPLRDLIAGLDEVGELPVPYARPPRRLAIYAEEFPRWADVAGQTPQALLDRLKLGVAQDAVRTCSPLSPRGKLGPKPLSPG